MATAIVTITCPKCGGEVKGIEATERAQTVPCTYCGTELHVPRVGDEIVRETRVVHEVREVPVPVELPVEPLRAPPKHVLPAALVACFGFFVVMVMMCNAHERADDTMKKFHERDAARDRCHATCRERCANVPAPPPSNIPEVPDLDKTMHEADITLCKTQCEQELDCYGLRTH